LVSGKFYWPKQKKTERGEQTLLIRKGIGLDMGPQKMATDSGSKKSRKSQRQKISKRRNTKSGEEGHRAESRHTHSAGSRTAMRGKYQKGWTVGPTQTLRPLQRNP